MPSTLSEIHATPQPPEHIPTRAKLCAFLMAVNKPQMCVHLAPRTDAGAQDPLYPWVIEEALLEVLRDELAKEDRHQPNIQDLRAMVYAATWEASPPPEPEALLKLIPSFEAAATTFLEHQREDESLAFLPPAAFEQLKENLHTLPRIIHDAIETRPCYDAAESAAYAIEFFYDHTWKALMSSMRRSALSWNDLGDIRKPEHDRAAFEHCLELMEQLNRWRPVRNYIYYFRAFKRWCEISHVGN